MASASARADALGSAVTVGALTTATSTTTADPKGGFTVRENVLPVRVRRGAGWVPVDTSLHRAGGGSWSPTAMPGDGVVFSGGGSGPLVTISAAGTSLSLWWPGRLPAPVVSGPEAMYRSVLPGIDLVLTATSGAAGGFSEVLVIHNAAAATNPALARLSLRVTGKGARLASAAGGGLVAAAGRAGYYAASAPLMWDSSSVNLSGPGQAVRSAAAAAARAAGAGLAPAWMAGPAASPSHPALGGRVAAVRAVVTGSGSGLTLVPDAAMLAARSTQWPAYVDPSFSWHVYDGSEQAFDPVQSECPAAHYNDSSSYPFSPVGYDNFQTSSCADNDTDYAYFQVAVPSQVWDGHLNSAAVNTSEVYTSDCTSSYGVTLSWTYGMSSTMGWSNKAGVIADESTVTMGPDADSCNNVLDTGARVAAGFNVLPAMTQAASGHWKAFTFRLWEKGSPSDVVHKQFINNPVVQISYNQTPSTPYGLQISTTGAGGAQCTTAPYPWVGQLASTGGTTMSAVVADRDGDQLGATFEYKLDSSSTWTTVTSTSTNIASGNPATAVIPASFTNALTDPNGTLVDWQVQAYDGALPAYDPDSAWSPVCHFYAQPTRPSPPTVTAGFTGNPVAGSQVSFTITSGNAAGDAAAAFVWGLDSQPSDVSPLTSQVITLAAGQTSATVTLRVPGPGPHALYAYTRDAAGNDSQMLGTADPATFTAMADPAVSYSSFAAALGAGQLFDNTMISFSSGASCGTTTGDGLGSDFDAADLSAAGWAPGGMVTVDGATFHLPSFGSCAADNVLAANQTIGLPAGSQGGSLVVLAASTNGNGSSPQAADLPVAGTNGAPEATAPFVTAGTAVAGYACYGYQVGMGSCQVPQGTITYTDGSAASYYLTVPDWWTGPTDISAVTLPHVVESGGTFSQQVKIYAFAVPLDPNATVASITLPDVGTADQAAVPALHILGIAVRNTTTATPPVVGTAAAAPAGQAWTGAFEAADEAAYGYGTGSSEWADQTIRVAASPNISAPAGAKLRIRLSDPGFLADDGTGPLSVGAASVAQQASLYSPVPVSGTMTALTFGGSASVTVPEGGDIYSDPVTLPFPVTAGQNLLISLFLQNAAMPYLPYNSRPGGASMWFAARNSGNSAGDVTGSPFTAAGSAYWTGTAMLTGVDVTTPATTVGGAASPGAPTIVVSADELTDANAAGTTAAADYGEPSIRVPGQLASTRTAAGFGVVDADIQSGQVLAGNGTGGVSLLSRLDRDILAEPDVSTVVIDEGLQDLLNGGSSTTVEAELENTGYAELVTQLQAWGITVIFGTLTPCDGYPGTTADSPADACTATVDANRLSLNGYLSGLTQTILAPYIFADDFSAAVGVNDPASTITPPEQELGNAAAPGDYETGDHVNLTSDGYKAVTATIPASQLTALIPPPG